MAAKKRRGPQQQMKGFRPGKEPPALKKKRAKAQLGADASWAQRMTVEAVAGRTPEQVAKSVKTWSISMLAGGLVLGVGGVFLYPFAVWAGVLVHVIAAVLLFLAFRLVRQGPALEEMAGQL